MRKPRTISVSEENDKINEKYIKDHHLSRSKFYDIAGMFYIANQERKNKIIKAVKERKRKIKRGEG